MKNIYVLVHDDAGQEARLQAALDVTRAVEGHLGCVDIVQLPVMVGDIYGLGGQAELIQAERDREAENRGIIEARLIREGISWDWIQAVGDLAPSLNELCDLADLIVLNRKLDTAAAPDMHGVAASVMLRSHRPILAVPERSRGFDPSGSAIVAWDGSAEAAAALRLSVPLLRLARTVELLTIGDNEIKAPASDAATYLSRHGISARLTEVPAGGDSVQDILCEQARVRRADYLVMGGYGHSRVAEALFGGVTHHMLSHCPVPLLLAH